MTSGSGENGSRPHRVLHFTTTGVSSNAYFAAIAELSDRTKVQPMLGTLEGWGELNTDMQIRGVPSFSLDCTRRSQFPRAVLRLARVLRSERIDVLQTHLFDASVVGLLAARLARVPVVILTGHHLSENTLYGWLPRTFDRLACRTLSDQVVTLCGEGRRLVADSYDVRDERIETIPLGFDLAAWNPDPARRAAARRELGVDDMIVIGAVGRLHSVKNYPAMIRAFAELRRMREDVVLVIAGSGAMENEIRQLIEALELGESVRLLGNRRDCAFIGQAFDIFIHTSSVESFGQIFVEAALLGTPIVTTRVGVASDIVIDGETGFFIRDLARDVCPSLRKAIEALPRLRENAMKNRSALGRYSREKMVSDYEALYSRRLSAVG